MVLRTILKIVVATVFVLVCGNPSMLYAGLPDQPDTMKQIKYHFAAGNATYLANQDALRMLDGDSLRPLMAVKTNLLFGAASMLNLEVEVPIGKHWSVTGTWIFPWILWKQQQVCLQVLSGNIEGRYWLGKRETRPQLTGWYTGFYLGGGLYDLEWKTKGYQGEFFIAAGLSAGYAHTMNKRGTLRLEYSLGIGYMQTKYREYIPINGGEILSWQKDGRYTWCGPTRAKVSLVWLISHRSKKGGRE